METKQEIPSVSEEDGSFPVRTGNKVEFVVDAEPFFQHLAQVLPKAKKSIWMAVSFISPKFELFVGDKKGPILDMLEGLKKEKGLDIRILFWRNFNFGLGTYHLYNGSDDDFETLKKKNYSISIRWDDSEDKRHCHHEKTWILDAGTEHEVAYLGGIVLTEANSVPKHRAPENPNFPRNRHDLMARVQGPSVFDAHVHFVQRWNHASGHKEKDGHWPSLDVASDLQFPTEIASPKKGNSRVQLLRTIRTGSYTSPKGFKYPIEKGEASILAQYRLAFENAKEFIYIENQHVAHPELLELLMKAMDRGVYVVYLAPGEGMGAAVHVYNATMKWKRNKEIGAIPKNTPPPQYAEIFLDSLPKLKKYSNFLLTGLITDDQKEFRHVYVHSKLAIVDRKFLTLGSANLVDLSFDRDHTELNVGVWDEEVASQLQTQLIEEHTNLDTSQLSAKNLFETLKAVATNNRELYLAGKLGLKGNLFAIDPEKYCSPKF